MSRVPREPEKLSQFASSHSPDVQTWIVSMTCPLAWLALADTPTGAGNGGIPVKECLLPRSRSPSGTQPRGGWEVWGLCPLCCVPYMLALTLHTQQVPGCAPSLDEAPPGALPLLPRPLITPNSNSHIRALGPAWPGVQPQG